VNKRELTQIDAVNTECIKTLLAGCFTILVRAVNDLEAGVWYIAKLGGEENLVSFSSTLEPFA
jgi:hypothetical protein